MIERNVMDKDEEQQQQEIRLLFTDWLSFLKESPRIQEKIIDKFNRKARGFTHNIIKKSEKLIHKCFDWTRIREQQPSGSRLVLNARVLSSNKSSPDFRSITYTYRERDDTGGDSGGAARGIHGGAG